MELLARLKEEKLRIDQWREKESTRDAVRILIHDFLYNEQTGLPIERYSDSEVENRSEEVFRHIFQAYPKLPSSYYAYSAVA